MHVRFEVMGSETESDDQALITEYGLLVAEYGIGKLWVKRRKSFQLINIRLYQRDVNRSIGVAGP
jgi:hypothetical protein